MMNSIVRNLAFGLGSFLIFNCISPINANADFPVDVAYAPANNLDLTVSAIKSARQSIQLNIYEFTSPEIADALVAQIQAGVQVTILAEGQIVGGLSAAGKGIESQIAQAMQTAKGNDHFYVMTSKAGGKRRYAFDHAKYAVIDGNQLLLGSENYSPTGNPAPGSIGNRGWEVFIHDSSIAQNYQGSFVSDADTTKGDVIDITKSGSMYAEFNPSEYWDISSRYPAGKGNSPSQNKNGPTNAITANNYAAQAVERISSPDTSLSGLLGLINNARKSIDIELMTFDSNWSGSVNPLVTALEQAAKRGVNVRVLLNDEAVFNHPGSPASASKNLPTAQLLNQAGAHAITANLSAMGVDYIHNKGMLVDSEITLISSINWDQNSIQRNREAAVAISSPGVNGYYEAIFSQDWLASGGK